MTEHIKQQIEDNYPAVGNSFSGNRIAATWGYSLAEQEIEHWKNNYNIIFDQSKNKIEEQDFEIEKLQQEITRLKGLLKKVYIEGAISIGIACSDGIDASKKQAVKDWLKFQTDNNL